MKTKRDPLAVSPLLRTCLFAFLILLCSLPAWADRQESVKKKEFNKTFSASPNDQLQVDNRFGSITITHWSKNEVSIQVVVEAKSRNEARAQAHIDRVSISMEKAGSVISALTILKNQTMNSGSNESFSINYYINMPASLTADLTQKYGNINMPESNSSKCALHVKYGNIKGGSFSDPLEIEAQYGNVEIGSVSTAVLDLAYVGKASLVDATTLNVDSRYSNLNIAHVNKLDMEIKYGKFNVRSFDKGSLDIKYSQGTIGQLRQELYVGGLSYSSLDVEHVSADFSVISIDARYGNLDLCIPTKASFRVNAADMKYGDYSVKGFNITRSSVEDKDTYHSEINGGGKGRISFEGNGYSNLKIRAN